MKVVLSRARSLVVAAAIALVGLVQLAGIVALALTPSEVGQCSVDVFGVQVPPAGTHCYIPIGEPLLFAAVTIAVAIAAAVRPRIVAPAAAIVSALLALTFVPAVLPEDGPINQPTLMLSLLAAIPFLVVVPAGPAANAGAHRAWVLVLLGAAALFVFDNMFSGFFRPVPPGPQLAFAVVALTVLAAGSMSGRSAGDAAPRTADSAAIGA